MTTLIEINNKRGSISLEVAGINPSDFPRILEQVVTCGSTIAGLAVTESKTESEE